MRDSYNVLLQRVPAAAGRISALARTRRVRRAGIAFGALFALFSIAGFLVVPRTVRGILAQSIAASIHRRVSVGRIRFNPYTLRLRVNRLAIEDRADAKRFASIERLDVRASWMSVLHLAPVITELTVSRPAISIVRNPEGGFNFSDLFESKSTAPFEPPRFSVANIRVIDGDVSFDDQHARVRHSIGKIDLSIPFISDMPGKIDVMVKPMLRMQVDGTAVRVAGVSRPFAGKLESALSLNFHRIDLTRFVSYLPSSIGIKVPSGALSLELMLRFSQGETGPHLALNGAVAVDELDVRDSSGAPLLAIDHGVVKMSEVEPLDRIVYLHEIALMGLRANIARNHDGVTNFAMLAAGAPANAPGAQAAKTPPFDGGIESIRVVGGTVTVNDLSGTSPADDALEAINATATNVRLNAQAPGTFQLSAKVASGGTIAAHGSLNLARSDFSAEFAVEKIGLPPLQPFAHDALAATIASGQFATHGTIHTHFAANHFDIHVEPADFSVDNLALEPATGRDPAVAIAHAGVTVGSFDLADRQFDIKEIRTDGIRIFAERDRGGKLSLTELVRKPPGGLGMSAPKEAEPGTRAAPARASSAEARWNGRIESVAIENSDVNFRDRAARRFVRIEFKPLNIHVRDISTDLAKPFAIELDGVRNRSGSFKIEGTAAIEPLNAHLQVDTQGLELAEIYEYASTNLNAELTRAALSVKGDLQVARLRNELAIKYRGDATVGGLAMTDKVTGDDFLNWRSLAVSGIDLAIGDGKPRIQAEDVALSDFYARLILNSSGKLNLNDIMSSPAERPRSLTREQAEPAAQPSPAAPAPRPLDADITIGQVTLKGGHVDYTDNFIRPHYSADLSDIAGSIGQFGTASQEPARVDLRGQVNGSAPVTMGGSINPLTPMASVDLRAKAEGIELTGLSPYSTKYTGYPIVRGTLTADVHYVLNNGELTASNHLFIDQFTFGDRVESATATNLPVRFAVAVLKNSRGEINLNIPISGSLSDPQFSISGVIWQAFFNTIKKAITSPFSLLAAAVGGIGGGGNQDLSYVPFEAGSATLAPEAKKGLSTLGNALLDHPALTLTICGRVDPKLDAPGLREAWVVSQIRTQKLRDVGSGQDPESIELTQADYDKYLYRAYAKTKFPKERNILGFARKLPPQEMKKLMIANAPIDDDSLQRLADARAKVVRQYLSVTVPPARLFVAAPKLNADGISEGTTTRADLSLQ